MRFSLLILLLFSVCDFVYAQSDTIKVPKQLLEAPDGLIDLFNKIKQTEVDNTSRDASLEIDGLLVNNTKTKNGNDFYDYFYRDWEAPFGAKNYTVFITEKPYRMTTTMIEVKINESIVFQSFLQPRSDIVEEAAKQAVVRTQLYLRNYEKLVKQLGGDDKSGSGIF